MRCFASAWCASLPFMAVAMANFTPPTATPRLDGAADIPIGLSGGTTSPGTPLPPPAPITTPIAGSTGPSNTGGNQLDQPVQPNITPGLEPTAVNTQPIITPIPTPQGPGIMISQNGQNETVVLPSIVTPDKATHILVGDQTGGGHLWPGLPGKSPFPKEWSAEQVLGAISDVATDPNSNRTPQSNGRIQVRGTRNGIDILVIVEPPNVRNGQIVTGYPTNIPKNPKWTINKD
jgi:filamentous hemagglutinin